jgi:hypothetical protein
MRAPTPVALVAPGVVRHIFRPRPKPMPVLPRPTRGVLAELDLYWRES